MTDMATYLAGLKAGDVVIVHSRIDGYRARSVDRVTKTQIIVGGAKFRRSDGYEMGPEWGRKSNINYPTRMARDIATFRAVRDALRSRAARAGRALRTLRHATRRGGRHAWRRRYATSHAAVF